MEVDPLSSEVIGCALRVYTALGPGLLESAYAQYLALELTARGVPYERELTVPIRYRGVAVDPGYRIDFLVASRLVVEIKAVERLHNVHVAHVRTYMKLRGLDVGLLINFQVVKLRAGIHRLELGGTDRRGNPPHRLTSPHRLTCERVPPPSVRERTRPAPPGSARGAERLRGRA